MASVNVCPRSSVLRPPPLVTTTQGIVSALMIWSTTGTRWSGELHREGPPWVTTRLGFSGSPATSRTLGTRSEPALPPGLLRGQGAPLLSLSFTPLTAQRLLRLQDVPESAFVVHSSQGSLSTCLSPAPYPSYRARYLSVPPSSREPIVVPWPQTPGIPSWPPGLGGSYSKTAREGTDAPSPVAL